MAVSRDARIERYLYAFDWDIEAIWALDLPVEDRLIDDLAWMLELPVWAGPNGPYSLSPMEVLKGPKVHAAEYVRMARADTSHPIDIAFHLDRWVVLDGVHRLLKLYRDGAQLVRVRVVPPEALIPKRS
ncbi:MAG: hypothetical protein WDN03_10645 [Rhizomicrobium sp.]